MARDRNHILRPEHRRLFEDAAPLDWLVAPVGGGGLLSGITMVASSLSPETKVVGVETETSNDWVLSLAAGHPVHIDPREFRNTVGQFVTGVTVAAAHIDGGTKAMTANAFTSLSLDPPLVLFCVGKKAHLGQAIHKASGFTVNILRQDQQNLSTYFAGGWKEVRPPALRVAPLPPG